MKLKSSQISKSGWVNTPHQAAMLWDPGPLITHKEQKQQLNKPNPPTKEMVEKAQFIDKTYVWKHARVRSGDQRSAE